ALNDPWRFLTKFEPGRTNPPLFHLFCALITFLAGTTRYLEAIGIVFSFINAAARYLLYRFLRETIADPFLRIAATVFLLFLPCAMVHAVVLASDQLATPIFIGTVYFA